MKNDSTTEMNAITKILEDKARKIAIENWRYSAPVITTRDIEKILKHRPIIFRGHILNDESKEFLITVLESLINFQNKQA